MVRIRFSAEELARINELRGYESMSSYIRRKVTEPALERVKPYTDFRGTEALRQMDKDQQQAQTAMHQIKDSAKKRGKHFTDTW